MAKPSASRPKTIITPAWVAKVPVHDPNSYQLRELKFKPVVYMRSITPTAHNRYITHRLSTGYAFRMEHLSHTAFVLSRQTNPDGDLIPRWCLNMLLDDGEAWRLGNVSDRLVAYLRQKIDSREHQHKCALGYLATWDALRLDVFIRRAQIRRAERILAAP